MADLPSLAVEAPERSTTPHASPSFLRTPPSGGPPTSEVTEALAALRSDLSDMHLLQIQLQRELRGFSERFPAELRQELREVKRPMMAEMQKLSGKLRDPDANRKSTVRTSDPSASLTSSPSTPRESTADKPRKASSGSLKSESGTLALSATFAENPENQENVETETKIEAVPKRRVQDKTLRSQMPARTSWWQQLSHTARRLFMEVSHDIMEQMRFRGVRLPGALAFLNVVPPLTILVNSVVIGMQSDIAPDSVIWDIFEIAFITVYSLEFVLKLRIFGCKGYFCGKEAGWNWFDFTCLLLSYVDIAVYYAVVLVLRRNGQTDLSSLMLIKIFRLSRLIRLVRLVRHKLFHELKVMLFGLWAGIRVLGWAIILLFGLIYTFGVFLRNIMGESFKELETVPDAMFTLFRCFRDDCAAYDGTPFPERVRETYGGIFMVSYILMIMTVSVGVFNLIMAIFIDNVTGSQLQRRNRELADSSEKVRVMIKEHVARFLGKDVRSRRTFVTGDLDVQHSILDEQLLKDEVVIHRESFQRWLQDPEFTEALEDAYIDVSNKAHLFDIMDADMGGHLSLDELVEGLMALRGSVNKGDIINMSLKIRLLTRHVDSVLSIVQHSLDPDGDLCSEAS